MAADIRLERIQALRLGESAEPVETDDSASVAAASIALARQARREILILSRNLDAAIYDVADFVQAAREFCLQHRHARIRVLVHDPGPAVRRSHRLVALAQRLSTYIEIRKPGAEHAEVNHAFLVADGTGYVHRPLADRYEGVLHGNDRAEATRLVRDFENVWSSALPDPGLRRLHL